MLKLRQAVFGLFALLTMPALAQETRATLSGTISDPSGAAVAGAKLRLINEGTAGTSTFETNQNGLYRFMFLNPGRYRLTGEMTGFRTFVREGIELSTNQAATIDITLQIGTQTETVTVGAEAPLLEAEKADRGGVVLTRNLAELPMITRTPILLATLSPGVTPTNPRYDLTPFSNSGLTTWSINGSTSLSTEFLMDGAPNGVIYQSAPSIAYVPPVDAVQELKVSTGAYDAQYGHNGGGVINMVVKSGTNRFHGSVYDFIKRPALNANTFANNARGAGRDINSLDEYGFSIGGPVRIPKVYNGKDRTFFFASWEKYKQNILFPANDISSVPTIAQRGGDFSQTLNATNQLMPVYDPQTGRLSGANWIRDPFPGNRIPSNRFDPVGQKIVGLYPEPNTTTAGSVPWQNNFYLSDNVTWYNFRNLATRLDHSLKGGKERIYGRYLWNNQILHSVTNGLTGYAADLREGTKINNGALFDSLTILSPTTTLDFRASITRWVQDYKPTNWGSYNATVIGWPASLVSQLPEPNRFPTLNINSYKSIGPSANNIWLAPTTTIALAPTLSSVRGRHALKAGLDFRWTHHANYQSIGTGGLLTFDRGFTRSNYLTQDALSGNAIASALLGQAASGQVDYLVKPYYQWMYYAPWVQDDIKVTRRLTINLGLRYDLTSPVTEKYDRLNRGFFTDQVNPISGRVDQTKFPGYKVNGGIGFAGKGQSRSPYDTDRNNWQPRAGAAFQLTPTTVLRGGWGLSYIATVSTGSTLGFSQSTPFVSSVDAGRTAASLVSNPFPSGILPPSGSSAGLGTLLGLGPTFSDPSGRLGYVHSFSFGIQKLLPGQVSIDASYVGSRTTGVPTVKGFNELSAQDLALGDVTRGGNPNFLNDRLPNPFENLLPGTGINTSTVPRQQLLRPYPQFTSFNRQDIPNGKVWYNSLQVAVQKRYSHGLMVTAAYTLSKNLQALNYLNPQDAAPARSLVPWDRPHRLVLAPIYELPFGPGKRFLTSTNGLASRVVGGWQMMMNSTLQSGAPMTVPGNVFLLGDPRLGSPAWDRMFKTGLIDADGVTVRNVQQGEQPVFRIQPAFSLRTASQYSGNLRNLWGREYNVTLSKNTVIREGYTV